MLVQFGAGNIGRSLAGQLFARAGWQVVFVDADLAVVDALNARHGYTIRVMDKLGPGQPDRIEVGDVSGLAASDEPAVIDAIARADLVGTSVGGLVLPKVLGALARGLERRSRPVSVLLCENLAGAGRLVRERLRTLLPADFPLDQRVGLVETSIGKMVPIMPAEVRRRDPLEVWAEAYNQIVADREGFIDTPPDVPGLVLKSSFAAYVDRKLYIHNFGHATAAYLGALRGFTLIRECMEDATVAQATRQAMRLAGDALIGKYPGEFTRDNQHEHIEDLLRRFCNPALGDTVFRVGRDLARKLAPGDRCIGALRLVAGQGGDPSLVCRVIAAALRFAARDEQGNVLADDAAFLGCVRQRGVRAVLIEHCGLDPRADAKLLDCICRSFDAREGGA